MKIRTKLRIGLLIFLFALIGMIAVAASRREALIIEQYQLDLLKHRQELWQLIVDQTVQVMRDKIWLVREDDRLRAALQDQDRAAIVEIGGAIMDQVRTIDLADRLELYASDGTPVYTSTAPLYPTAVVNAETLTTVAVSRDILGGVGNEKAKSIAVTITFPIQDRETGALLGLATLAREVSGPLHALSVGAGAEVLIVNRRGRVLGGSGTALWEILRETARIDHATGFTRTSAQGRSYLVSWFPLAAERGNLLARMVMIQDETESANAVQRTSLGFLAILTIVVLAAGFLFSLSLRGGFARLLGSVEVLQSLAQGNLAARVETPDQWGAKERARDEFAIIEDAVNRLREELIAFARLRRSRIKHRLRQERLIRQKLGHLAETLEPEARAEVLADLAEIEAANEADRQSADRMLTKAQEDGVAGSEGLGMMALTFEKLATRVVDQQDRLSRLVEELREALRTKTAYLALQQELEIARRLQLSILPQAFTGHEAVALKGRMEPAKEVGGDFYDFFMLDGGRIGVIIADVSGKGIPAAFFMTISRTLMRALTQRHDSPAACLADVNDALIENNPEDFFVTVFYGIYDPAKGLFRYASAGHNPPVLLQNGRASFLTISGNPPLGMLDGLKFREYDQPLGPGDGLMLYTDGVTEAFDPDETEYGDDRLRALLDGRHDEQPDEVLACVFADVEVFVRGAPQADDITCLSLLIRSQPEAQSAPV